MCISDWSSDVCSSDLWTRRVSGAILLCLQVLYLSHNCHGMHVTRQLSCPRLRKLWLFSNRISRIEELHHCGFLTELWLQDNQIDKIEGLNSLVSLQIGRAQG